MKTHLYLLLALTLVTGCVTEKCIRLDNLTEQKINFIRGGKYQEALLSVSDETKRIYSLIRMDEGIYFRERNPSGKLLMEHKVSGDWFAWYQKESTGDYEPTAKRLAYFGKEGDLLLCDMVAGVTRAIWRGGKTTTGMNRALPWYIHFADTNHILLIYSKTGDESGIGGTVCVALVSIDGEEKRICEFSGLQGTYFLAPHGRLYFADVIYGEGDRCFGYIDLFQNSPVFQKVLKLPRWGNVHMDVSGDDQKAMLILMGSQDHSNSVTRLLEIDIPSGHSRDVVFFKKEDKANSVYPRVKYLSKERIAVTICPRNFWNWAGNNKTCVYDVKSGNIVQEIAAPNLMLFVVLHEDGQVIMVSSVY
jgi:hypothetical protein